MTDAERHNITTTLQDDANPIARGAALIFFGRMNELIAAGQHSPLPFREVKGGHGLIVEDAGPDEAMRMVQEGFARLGGVVALAVLVDEPGLIADDMHWLKRMLGARQQNINYAIMFDMLLQSYVEACSQFVEEDQVAVIEDTVRRAKAILGEDMAEGQ
jgi:hypothetical protein